MATLGSPAHWTTQLQPLSAETKLGLLKLQLRAWLRGREPVLHAGGPGLNSSSTRNRNPTSVVQPRKSAWPAPMPTLTLRAHGSPGSRGRSTSGALWPRHGCHGSTAAGRPPTLRAELAAPRRPRSAATMSLGTADLASETVRRPEAAGGQAHGSRQLPQADCYRTRASPGRRPPPCPCPSSL